jgi:hypothetical protein
MRSITVSTDVFARIWALRDPGEETEDAILSRLLGCAGKSDDSALPANAEMGLRDARSGVLFPEEFEVFRTYLGVEYRARVTGGRWILRNDIRPFQSLNELSKAIGAKTENAWTNWHYLDAGGMRKLVSELREPGTIATRLKKEEVVQVSSAYRDPARSPSLHDAMDGDGTWRDDVRNALHCLGGRASLYRIYREVEAIRSAAGRSVPPSLEATVRRTLEDHSSDSDNYRGQDIFCMPDGKGAGVWALR